MPVKCTTCICLPICVCSLNFYEDKQIEHILTAESFLELMKKCSYYASRLYKSGESITEINRLFFDIQKGLCDRKDIT